MVDDPNEMVGSEDVVGHGVVLRASNGDVIRYDPSGLVMRLSDRVVEDLELRLSGRLPDRAAESVVQAAELPNGIDGWDAVRDGDWIRFTARLPGGQGVRGFRAHMDGGDIIAECNGPLLGLLGIGGARAALATRQGADFPQHILAPADDIGAVGHTGIELASNQDRLEHLREMTHEALCAQAILHWRMTDFGPLPVFVTRVETDASVTSADLATGRAVENLLVAAKNLRAAADLMGKPAKVLAVTLDFALEDHSATANAYRDGMLAVMEAVSGGLWQMGFGHPLFVARFASGLPSVAPQAALDGQWELSWSHGDHRLIYSAPEYMFALDDYDRPTPDARQQQAEMTASAIAEAADWKCPTLHLAEVEGTVIRLAARAVGPLTLDETDPFGAGATFGFQLAGCSNKAQIQSVNIAGDDPQTVLITLDNIPKGADLRLRYDAGALRDDWALESTTGARLHRWALPANLPVTGGRNA